jgi:hypothetical protein
LLTTCGLLLLKVWAKYVAYVFAADLSLSWLYAVWQVTFEDGRTATSSAQCCSCFPGRCCC